MNCLYLCCGALFLLPTFSERLEARMGKSSSAMAQSQTQSESINIDLQGRHGALTTELSDPNYYGKSQSYKGFGVDQLLKEDAKLLQLITKAKRNPELLGEYLVLFHAKDGYLSTMDLDWFLDCDHPKLPADWLNGRPCAGRSSSGFIATSQLNVGEKPENRGSCLFDAVANRLPERVCPGDYYLVWPRLREPKYEFKTPYQLTRIEIIKKAAYYRPELYPQKTALARFPKEKGQSILRGVQHYLRYCSSCHSVNLYPIEKNRSFDFSVPKGLAELTTKESLEKFLYSENTTMGAERFDPKELTPKKIEELYLYLDFMAQNKVCDTIEKCRTLCRETAKASPDKLCGEKRFLAR